jgi:hypothetical protein
MGQRKILRILRANIPLTSAVAGILVVAGAGVGADLGFRHPVADGRASGAAGTAPPVGAARQSLPPASAAAANQPTTTASSPTAGGALPHGVVLQDIDGGPAYFSRWKNGFPGGGGFVPIGVYPSESKPAALAAEGINFFMPMRDESAGRWCPVWSNPNGNDMNGVDAQKGFYAGGDFYETTDGRDWGPRAAFNVFGDELDGNAGNWFDCVPPSVNSHRRAGSWGGLSAADFEAAEAASRAADPTRPTYIQTTVTFMDGGAGYFYSLAQKQAICSGADIFSFDVYPLVLRGGHVWDMYDQIEQARAYCRDARPVMAFTEMDRMSGGSVYPRPAQTAAEVWNAIIAGARGVEYFDQYSTITDQSYDGGGRYAAGAMYAAIRTVDSQIAVLAPVINAPFARGYVRASGSVSVMAKYYGGHFYIFAIPHGSGARTVTFALAGAPSATVSVLNENRTLNASGGAFTDAFADENTVHIYEVR